MSTSNSDGLRQCYTRHPLCSIIKKISNSIPPFTKLQEEQWAWRPPFSVVERLAWEASGFKYPGIYLSGSHVAVSCCRPVDPPQRQSVRADEDAFEMSRHIPVLNSSANWNRTFRKRILPL